MSDGNRPGESEGARATTRVLDNPLDHLDVGQRVMFSGHAWRVTGIATRPPTEAEVDANHIGPDDRVAEVTLSIIPGRAR